MTVSIVIAEDNPKVAKALQEKLELNERFKIKYRCLNGQELLDRLKADHLVDVVLMDINMPVMDGIQATEKLKKLYPQIKVVMSTIFDEEDFLLKAILAGASGYLLKDEKPRRIHAAIDEVLEGGAPMSSAIAHKTLTLIRGGVTLTNSEEELDYKLTKRELQILEQISTGLAYHDIAENLSISPSTVRKHIENVYQKLQVHSKVEAVQLAIRKRLI
jgi:DNA-binding NarL/FixJ family response regulator